MPDNRSEYVCPRCKTRIPFGTTTEPPPTRCPVRNWIPALLGFRTAWSPNKEHRPGQLPSWHDHPSTLDLS
jgi:hypothetical protein